MIRIRDVFAGYAVRLEPVADRWAVTLLDSERRPLSTRTCGYSMEAMEHAQDLLAMIGSYELVNEDSLEEAELRVAEMIAEATGRVVAGELLEGPAEPAAAVEIDRLREWYEREMET